MAPSRSLGERPATPGVVDAEAADLLGVGAGRSADLCAPGDALEDHREAEAGERQVEVGDALGAAGACAIAGN